jgi:hypothetical protein
LHIDVSFSGSTVFVVAFLATLPFKDGNGRLDYYCLALRRTQQTIRKGKQNWDTGLYFPQDDGQAEEQPCREGQRGASSAFVLAGALSPDTGARQN